MVNRSHEIIDDTKIIALQYVTLLWCVWRRDTLYSYVYISRNLEPGNAFHAILSSVK